MFGSGAVGTDARSGTDRSGRAAPRTAINISAGFGELLRRHRISIAFTSYQSGDLFLVGLGSNGRVSVDQQRFERAMGVAWDGSRLHLATATQVIRFENMLLQGEIADERNDAVLVPRLSWTTNDIDVHELAVDGKGRPLFVATKFNCVATVDDHFSFSPVWMPPFLPGCGKGDRCHLNGLALEDGRLALATLVSASVELEGWREHRRDGGAVVDCRTGEIVVAGLSMPHSPRLHAGSLWFLDSGTGYLVRVERDTGQQERIAFCPGFARGLSIEGGFAVVTVSKPRDDRFAGLQLTDELAARGIQPWCGIVIVELVSGAVVGWLRLEGAIQELFDVAVLPRITSPRALGPGTRELLDTVRPRFREPNGSSGSLGCSG